MIERFRLLIAPAYLFACLILGGSAQGVWANMLLQLLGLAIIAVAAWNPDGETTRAPDARYLLLLIIALIAFVAVQLVPLPSSIWAEMGGRQVFAREFGILGMSAPAQSLSLAPASTLSSLLGFIPPLAIFCAMTRLGAYTTQGLAIALISGTVAGICLGALQVATAAGRTSTIWYLFSHTSYGKGVGFFANADHMATLLVITIPFLAAAVAAVKRSNVQRYSAVMLVSLGLAGVILVGIALNGSLAGYGLALPVVLASSLLIVPNNSRIRAYVLGLSLLLLLAAVIAIEFTAVGSSSLVADARTTTQSRADLFWTSWRAALDYMPFGSGLGTLPDVYPLYENVRNVTNRHVVHSHNDYIELVVELGIVGVLLILLFLRWWATAVWRLWSSSELKPFARAAAIASGAILVHSFVDFPLRTAAIAACFAMCIAVLAGSSAAVPGKKSARRTRNVVFT